ncbi:MAG: DUF1638 domain-containing protein [Clostridiales bacterium]|nr:DUF1638 domain-containing protein [Clostridiales bacterium]
MFIKFICCDVFARIACELVSRSPHIVDLEFIPMLAHQEPKKLNRLIQEKIDQSLNDSGRKYDAVILGFGLCGNSVVGLSCAVPLVIPRAHDCCTIHMGSKEGFIASFGNQLSARWCSTGYYERAHVPNSGYFGPDQLENYKTSVEYMKLVDQYGEEDADFIWETMHPKIETNEAYYIRIEGYEHSGAYEGFQSKIAEAGKELITVRGDTAMLKALVDGEWDEAVFLTVPPGKKIEGVYDMDQVVKYADGE